MDPVRLAVALTALLVTVSGCVGDDRGGPDGAGTAAGVGAGLNNTTVPVPPIEVYVFHDFTRGDETLTVEVPPNATLELYNVFFAVMPHPDSPAGACATLLAKIVIRDPTGAVYDELSAAPTQTGFKAAGGDGACGGQKTEVFPEPVPFGPPGVWEFEFTGAGAAWGFIIMNTDAEKAPRM